MSIDAGQEPLTVEVFRESGWREIIAGVARRYNSALQSAFSEAASKADEVGDTQKSQCLSLLGAVCSMILSPEKFNEPFKPYMVWDGKRSMIPSDLQEDNVLFLSQLVGEIDNYWLKARVADIAWLLLRPRNVSFALDAIDSYARAPLDKDNLVGDGKECWQRAIYLCRALRKGSGNRLEEIEQTIFAAFENATAADGYLAIWLADLLDIAYSKRTLEIAQKLESIADHFNAAEDYDKARDYFGRTVAWYEMAKEKGLAIKMAIAEAEMLAKQGYARISGDDPSHMVAVHFFEKAIQLYRAIPKAERIVHGVDARITSLYQQLAVSGEETLHELTPISSSFDITQLVEESRKWVKGKSQLEALTAFANIHPNINKKRLRTQSEQLMRDHPLLSIFPSKVFAGDGRVIAKNSGIDLQGLDSEGNERTILISMIGDYTNQLGLVVQAYILPALQILQLEHRFTEADFVELCLRTPIIPRGNEMLLGRALYAGFENDFTVALHLLIPQVESLVRFHLKARGAKTTTLDADGIQTENGLSTLVDLPEMELAFGEDLTFEIRALFCDSHGPNLRNQLAHGLLSFAAFDSSPSIYAWWFWLRIVVRNFTAATSRKG
ncbi:MAG: DUF4209 domain-containing protein [Hymenobacter sp.]|nr:MAG: DUF4209 domain-containing protein [Hymenobacter sp.]